jgi:rhamnulokinase
MKKHQFLAFDLGAESGRSVAGVLEDGFFQVRPLHRFANEVVTIQDHLHWNALGLFGEIKRGMKTFITEFGESPASLAVDTWGVDFALLDHAGRLIELPFSYRDSRTQGMMEEFFKLIPRPRIYELTGIQFMPLNTLFQLFSMVKTDSPTLKQTEVLLFMPDLINFLLCAVKKTEFTFATTSQLFNPLRRQWDGELFTALGVSRDIMQQIVEPGTVLGSLANAVCRETGMDSVPVIATASHDTASAVAAVPARGDDWIYISSGTWSLMGIEIDRPLLSQDALRFNFTNEGGVGNTFRFLKNIMGLWLLQACRKDWNHHHSYTYEELLALAENAAPFRFFVDPDCPDFLNPPSMVAAIQQYCLKTGQAEPRSIAEIARCVLESLALKYREVLDELRQIHPRLFRRIHIIGGGCQNRMLCQFAADATGLPILAGPVEATAIGNILVQAQALGIFRSVAEIRDTVERSFTPVRYEPKDDSGWNRAYERYRVIVGLGKQEN